VSGGAGGTTGRVHVGRARVARARVAREHSAHLEHRRRDVHAAADAEEDREGRGRHVGWRLVAHDRGRARLASLLARAVGLLEHDLEHVRRRGILCGEGEGACIGRGGAERGDAADGRRALGRGGGDEEHLAELLSPPPEVDAEETLLAGLDGPPLVLHVLAKEQPTACRRRAREDVRLGRRAAARRGVDHRGAADHLIVRLVDIDAEREFLDGVGRAAAVVDMAREKSTRSIADVGQVVGHDEEIVVAVGRRDAAHERRAERKESLIDDGLRLGLADARLEHVLGRRRGVQLRGLPWLLARGEEGADRADVERGERTHGVHQFRRPAQK
jgi:hypothetical protein